MKLIQRAVAAAALTAAVGSANAGIPVIDVANLAQAVQQVIAWGQQYTQMAQQITTMQDQYTQLTNTYNSMTGNRGLGTLLNGAVDQAARRYLPAGGAQIGQLSSGVAGFGSLQATINGYKASVTSLPTTWFSAGSTAATALSARVNSLATQQAVGRSRVHVQRAADSGSREHDFDDRHCRRPEGHRRDQCTDHGAASADRKRIDSGAGAPVHAGARAAEKRTALARGLVDLVDLCHAADRLLKGPPCTSNSCGASRS